MKFFRKFALLSTLATTILVGVAVPGHATGNPEMEMWLSSNNPQVGEPVAIYVEIFGCATIPTDVTISIFRDDAETPSTTLTKSSSGFKSRIYRGDAQLQWLYRGPLGQGVDSSFTFVEFSASGGCVVDPQTFRRTAMWEPTLTDPKPRSVNGITLRGIDNGMSVYWSPSFIAADASSFYEVQYAVANSNQWSRSFVTKDLQYVISGLAKGTVYDFRVRATNRNGSGEWTVINDNNGQSVFHTPAAFSVWAEDSAQNRKTIFGVNETITIRMHLTNCQSQPSPDNQWGGTADWTLFPFKYGIGDGYNTRSGVAESSPNSTAVYDPVAKTYDLSFDISGLTVGTYALASAFFWYGCEYPLSPVSASGSPQGSFLEFTVGDIVPAIPFWGSAATPFWSDVRMEAIPSLTTATVNWTSPKNILDGPFSYAVYLSSGPGNPKYLGTTNRNSYTITGLTANTGYQVEVRALNSLQTNREIAPSEQFSFKTRAMAVSKKSKTTASKFASLVGIRVPKGATLSMSRSKDKLAFLDCTVVNNVLQASGSVGACTVDFVITPKKVGKTKPVPIKSSYDVMVKN